MMSSVAGVPLRTSIALPPVIPRFWEYEIEASMHVFRMFKSHIYQ
jgi:hypothetical protein